MRGQAFSHYDVIRHVGGPAIRQLIEDAKAKREAFIKRFNLSPTPG